MARAAGRRRLRRLLVALAIVVVLGAAVGVVFSPLLDVDRFEVRGADDRVADVIAASGIDRGAPILLADLAAAEEQIAGLPWVGSVRVERALLGTIRVVVRASVPVAWVTGADGSVVLLDARGRPQTAPAPETDVAAPDPTGTTTGGLPELVVAPEDVAVSSGRTARAAARVAASLGPLAGRVASIVVVDGVAVLHLTSGPEVRFGRVNRLSEKARATAAVLAAPGIEDVGYLDVSAPAAPVTG
ncbi:MAG TPA: FtsQ-type POTRA domain-containing protein [Acidimicrobiia bacterium]|nr:FtsQ-type POTRA domain-containing protein [Acidimicrobiia bacterium]